MISLIKKYDHFDSGLVKKNPGPVETQSCKPCGLVDFFPEIQALLLGIKMYVQKRTCVSLSLFLLRRLPENHENRIWIVRIHPSMEFRSSDDGKKFWKLFS